MFNAIKMMLLYETCELKIFAGCRRKKNGAYNNVVLMVTTSTIRAIYVRILVSYVHTWYNSFLYKDRSF